MNFFANMPQDPFADDPNDPASFIEDDEQVEPISELERLELMTELAMVQQFAQVLPAHGIDGVFMFCEDCEEPHYYDWDIMISNIEAMINDQLAAVHEPSAEPNPMRYVPWEYAMGFVDGLNAHQQK
ncbi:MAG: DUF5319 domain-containing protein [Corynebacterium sp.]|nr:DUF5319 domain-containing protein [Corynebacterium sp.]